MAGLDWTGAVVAGGCGVLNFAGMDFSAPRGADGTDAGRN